jgi:carbon-monoxide dehydrogenase medium subunit
MKSFTLHQPADPAQAAALLAERPEAVLLAGGMTLLPTMKQRLAAPSDLVDLARIEDISGILVAKNTVTIGAMTRHVAVAESAELGQAIPALCTLAGGIGDPAVRNRGTLGGSIANADPAADYPAAVLALAATIKTSKRTIFADDFFAGLFETALAPGEMIESVAFRIPSAAGYVKMPSPASRYALVGVFVARFADEIRVGVTGAGPCAFRATAIEQALSERFEPGALEGVRISPDGLNSDIHADAQYRAHLVSVLAKRAVAKALDAAG